MASSNRVRFRPSARRDLLAIHDYLAKVAGVKTAGRYIDRIERACHALATFPERGTLHDDIRQGVRAIGFERRATIAFRVLADGVQIVRILYGGRDIRAALADHIDRD